MTKKDKILKIFNSKKFNNGWKIFTYEDFFNEGLAPTIEYGQSYCDVIYAKRILQKMGYRVLIGSCFYIEEKKNA